VTIGAAGSHHVLTTTYFARLEGIEVEAVLVPQPRTDHVVEVLRSALALGLRATPVRSWGAAAVTLALRLATAGARTRYVPVGGSSVIGSMGYVAAARELAAQVRAGAMPEPDTCIVALGSGGTAAGLAAGFAAERMKTQVVGICISKPPWALRLHANFLARACARHTPEWPRRFRLIAEPRFVGAGYGHSTREGDEATRVAQAAGLELDPTYTAKAFAGALWHLSNEAQTQTKRRDSQKSDGDSAQRPRVLLYWHTLGKHMRDARRARPTPSARDLPELAELAELARLDHLLLTTRSPAPGSKRSKK
jgi:D-cysteine desulfhydrase